MTSPASDDDLLPDLTPLDDDATSGLDDDEVGEALDVGAEALDDDEDDEGAIGLDGDQTDEDLVDGAELLDIGASESEGWTGGEGDSEELFATVDDEVDDGGAEYGYTGDAEGLVLDEDEEGDRAGDEAERAPSLIADAGEEGFEESHGGDDSLGDLPPLTAGPDGEGLEDPWQPEIDPARADLDDDPVGPALPPLSWVDGRRLTGHSTCSIAIGGGHGAVAVGTTAGSVLVTRDGGESFDELGGAPGSGTWAACEVAFAGARLWLRTGTGRLHVSDDLGLHWSDAAAVPPVLALAASGGDLVALCAEHGRLLIARWSPAPCGPSDGWTVHATEMVVPIARGAEGTWHVAASGSLVAIAREDDRSAAAVSRDGGLTWEPAPHLGSATALAAASERGAVVLYVARWDARAGRGVVVRRDADEGEQRLLDTDAARLLGGADEGDDDARVAAIAVTNAADGTTLWLASGVGVMRVDLRGWPSDR